MAAAVLTGSLTQSASVSCLLGALEVGGLLLGEDTQSQLPRQPGWPVYLGVENDPLVRGVVTDCVCL